MKFFSGSVIALWAAILFAYLTTINCNGIACYQCTVAPNPGAKFSTSQICSQFEKTTHFQTYCPNSTLCMKRSIHHRLGNGTLVLTSVERGCAPQLHVSPTFDYDAKRWYSKQEIITSAYDERCFIGEDRGSPGGPPEYCFCSYHLCNSSDMPNSLLKLIIFLTGFSCIWTGIH